MGPQFFHCGNDQISTRTPLGDGLQWGRSSFTAEIERNNAQAVEVTLLQWGRSSFTAEIRVANLFDERALIASMGPQFFHCGNVVNVDQSSPNGCASMGPQFFHCGNIVSTAFSLRPERCFNGAAVLSLRKWSDHRRRRFQAGSFNGAAVLSLRKFSLSGGSHNVSRNASMGPQFFHCGNKRSRWGSSPWTPLQWGRSSFTAEIANSNSATTPKP